MKIKKNKVKQVDYGGQELIKTDQGLIRKVDGAKLRLVLAMDGRRLEHEHKSLLENYHARDLLDIYSKDLNNKRLWAGQKFEKIIHYAGIKQRITASLKEKLGNGSNEHFVASNIDSYSEFHFIIKEIGDEWNILWEVIVNNNPAKKRMDELRNALDKLIKYFNI